MLDLTYVSGWPSASPSRVHTSGTLVSSCKCFRPGPSLASSAPISHSQGISPSLLLCMFFPLPRMSSSDLSAHPEKPQGLFLPLTLSVLLNSLELFFTRGPCMNFRKLEDFSPPHEHAPFSLISHLRGSHSHCLEGSPLLHSRPPTTPTHTCHPVSPLPEIRRHSQGSF